MTDDKKSTIPPRAAGSTFPGILGLLLTAFIFCKAAGITAIAAWSWWAVLIPLWIMLGILGVVIAGVVVVAIVGASTGRRR